MRVLYITTELPYPLTSGFLRHYHFLRALGQRHTITYLSLTRRPKVSGETYEALRPYTERMMIFGTPSEAEPWPVRWAGRAPAAGRQWQRALRLRWAAQEMKRTVQELIRQEKYDLIFFSGKDTFPAIEHIDSLPVVIDCCDATSLRVTGEMRYASLPRRLWLMLRLLEVRRIEQRSVHKTPYLAFASLRDQEAILGSAGGGEIVPQAVDLQYWTRRTHQPRPWAVVFTGVMNYPPNHDAAMILVEDVLPQVRRVFPDVEGLIVGRNPLPALRRAAEGYPNITLTGQPADMRDYFEQATVACAPVRFASGMQFKVLEALAMQVPMVTTSRAAEGLHIDGDKPPAIVADTPNDLADGIIKLLKDPGERARLALAGRQFVEKHFVWDRSIQKIERMWGDAAANWPATAAQSAGRPHVLTGQRTP